MQLKQHKTNNNPLVAALEKKPFRSLGMPLERKSFFPPESCSQISLGSLIYSFGNQQIRREFVHSYPFFKEGF